MKKIIDIKMSISAYKSLNEMLNNDDKAQIYIRNITSNVLLASMPQKLYDKIIYKHNFDLPHL